MKKQFEILKANRILILELIKNVTLNQLNKIPSGFKNNIAWNIAHLVVTQQLLCYKYSGLQVLINEDMISKYQKGTKPEMEISQEELESIIEQLLALPDTFEEDFNAGIFKEYQAYSTSVNVTLNTVEEALAFNNFHEGIHLGVILTLKKFI